MTTLFPYTTLFRSDEDGADDGAEELGNPVEDAGEDGDLAAEGEAEGDGGVDVAAGDVGADGDRDEEPEPVANRHRNQPGRIKRRAAAQLRCTFVQFIINTTYMRSCSRACMRGN